MGNGSDSITNLIQITGFTVEEDIVGVDILMSNDSDNTFSVIESFDTSIDKVVPNIDFTNSNAYKVLGKEASDIINNQFPLTATEQCFADNVLVYGDVSMDYKYEDADGNALDKSIPFDYATTGITYGNTNVVPIASDTAGSLTIAFSFVLGKKYRFTISGFKYNASTTEYDPHVYQFDWTYSTGTTTADSYLAYHFANANPLFLIAPAPLINFTVTGLNLGQSALSGLSSIKVDQIQADNSNGLNADFIRKAGIVWLDAKGRNVGVTNITDISYDGDEWTYNVKPNISASGITPPHFATKYMFVRDKVQNNLSYSILGSVSSAVDTDYNKVLVDTQYYTNYIAGERGKKIVVYSKQLQTDVEVQVLTEQDKTDEGITDESGDYIYFKADIPLGGETLILFQPTKDADSETEIFYETSDVFTLTYDGSGNPVFGGDTVDKLAWYDSFVGDYDGSPYVIMKTDTESLFDINHLGRGAYTVLEETMLTGNSTLIHSQAYEPSSNKNGLAAFNSYYNNYVDLELGYGSVELIHFDETNLLVGQKRKWNRILINKNMLSTATGQGAVQSSTSYFNQVTSIGGDFGITDKRSFDFFGYRKYFVDSNRGMMGRISADGISSINAQRDDEIIDLCNIQSRQDSIVGGYDVKKKEYVVVFGSTSTILRFSEKSKQSVGNYNISIPPVDFININTDLYTVCGNVGNGTHNYNMYLEGVGSTCKYYETTESPLIAIAVNVEPNIIKDFISISLNSESYNSTPPFDSVEIETHDNLTTLSGDDFLERENVFYADFMKDENSSGEEYLGVGNLGEAVTDNKVVTLQYQPTNLRVGGSISTSGGYIGVVESFSGNSITLEANMITTPSVGDLIYTVRDNKVEGNSIKGRVATVTMTSGANSTFKLFGVTTNVNLSSNTD